MAIFDIGSVKESLKFGKDKRQTLLLGVLILLGIVVLYTYMFFKPFLGVISRFGQRISRVDSALFYLFLLLRSILWVRYGYGEMRRITNYGIRVGVLHGKANRQTVEASKYVLGFSLCGWS